MCDLALISALEKFFVRQFSSAIAFIMYFVPFFSFIIASHFSAARFALPAIAWPSRASPPQRASVTC